MREIKFRSWCCGEFKDGKMYYSDQPIKIRGTNIISLSTFFQTYYEDTFTMGPSKLEYVKSKDNKLMQFTGLKDKNGKEIYEGDIINYIYSYSEFDIADCESKEQKIIDTIFDISMFQGVTSHFDIEVIGNIYENPEMMEKEG